VTVFDDGAGAFAAHRQSRGVLLRLDFRRFTATRVNEVDHSPGLLANFEGNFQQLPGGNEFVGWGQQPYFSEYDRKGRLIFDARFVDENSTYIAMRFRWNGNPNTLPAVAASTRGRTTTVYASWNGATSLSSWRVLGGSNPNSLRAVGGGRRSAFETAISVGAQRYVAVEALDSRGRVLKRSGTIRG
jgi:hypothetical protein